MASTERKGAAAGKFLQIFFGCHGRADRSFFFRGRQFPICARCTGELIGILVGIPIVFFAGYPPFFAVLLLMLPMVCDGCLQLWTAYESGNMRRLITGMLFGAAMVFFFIYFHRTCVIIASYIVNWIIDDPLKTEQVMSRFLP